MGLKSKRCDITKMLILDDEFNNVLIGMSSSEIIARLNAAKFNGFAEELSEKASGFSIFDDVSEKFSMGDKSTIVKMKLRGEDRRIIFFSVRRDTKKINKKILKQIFRKQCRKWKEDHERTRVPRDIKQDMKLDLAKNMMRNQTPDTNLIDVAMIPSTGELYISSSTKSRIADFLVHFAVAFGTKVEPVNFYPYDCYPRNLVLQKEKFEETNINPTLFVMWCLFKIAKAPEMKFSIADSKHQFDLTLNDKIKFLDASNNLSHTIQQGILETEMANKVVDDLSIGQEIKMTLSFEYNPSSFNDEFENELLEVAINFLISVKEFGLLFKAIEFPKYLGTKDDNSHLETMMFVTKFYDMMRILFREHLKDNSEEWCDYIANFGYERPLTVELTDEDYVPKFYQEKEFTESDLTYNKKQGKIKLLNNDEPAMYNSSIDDPGDEEIFEIDTDDDKEDEEESDLSKNTKRSRNIKDKNKKIKKNRKEKDDNEDEDDIDVGDVDLSDDDSIDEAVESESESTVEVTDEEDVDKRIIIEEEQIEEEKPVTKKDNKKNTKKKVEPEPEPEEEPEEEESEPEQQVEEQDEEVEEVEVVCDGNCKSCEYREQCEDAQ